MHTVIIIFLILAILLVIFTLQNAFMVTITLFFWEIPDAPLVLLLFCSILFGYLLSAIYFYPRIWKLKKMYRRALKSANKTEEEQEKRTPDLERPGAEGIELEIVDDNDNGFFEE